MERDDNLLEHVWIARICASKRLIYKYLSFAVSTFFVVPFVHHDAREGSKLRQSKIARTRGRERERKRKKEKGEKEVEEKENEMEK